MDIFEFEDYKAFVSARLKALPGRGRGEYRKMATFMNVHTSLVSQIFNGDKDLSPEQGFSICKFLGLSELEAKYFLLLIQIARAGDFDFKRHLTQEMNLVRAESRQNKKKMEKLAVFDETRKSVFYSNWYYSAVHLSTSLAGLNQAEAIARRLSLDPVIVKEVLDFLASSGLCSYQKGKYFIKQTTTKIANDDELSNRHNVNWRFKGVERLPGRAEGDYFHSNQVSLSSEDAEKVKNLLKEISSEVIDVVKPSKPEKLFCLNVDWFEF